MCQALAGVTSVCLCRGGVECGRVRWLRAVRVHYTYSTARHGRSRTTTPRRPGRARSAPPLLRPTRKCDMRAGGREGGGVGGGKRRAVRGRRGGGGEEGEG